MADRAPVKPTYSLLRFLSGPWEPEGGGAINSRATAFESPLRPAGRALRIFEDRKKGFARAERETIILFQVKVKQVQRLFAQLPFSLFQDRTI